MHESVQVRCPVVLRLQRGAALRVRVGHVLSSATGGRACGGPASRQELTCRPLASAGRPASMKLREGGPGDVAPAHLQQVDCTTHEQAQPSVAPPTPDADVDRGAISLDVLAPEVPRFQGLARMPSSAGLFRMPLILATVPRAPSARHWRTNWRSLRGLTTRCNEAYTVGASNEWTARRGSLTAVPSSRPRRGASGCAPRGRPRANAISIRGVALMPCSRMARHASYGASAGGVEAHDA
jgi:hypothetical protein